MQYTTLGRTGLRVSIMGMGCGGHSRLGQSQQAAEEQSVAVVRRAMELGVNLIDTAEGYGTEPIVGKAIAGRRDGLVICTKKGVGRRDGLVSPEDFEQGVNVSLGRLGVDCIDLMQLHGVGLDQYDHAINHIVPVLMELRDAGKIRFLGLTERFGGDTRHQMFQRALQDDCWDVVMVGFNVLNQTARDTVFPVTQQKSIGTLDMFAVRRALSHPERLREVIAELVEQGKVDEPIDRDDPLGFVREMGAESVTDAAYRFCRDEPGVDVVLVGTGNVEHLEVNAASLDRPPLPEALTERLRQMFARVDCVAGN